MGQYSFSGRSANAPVELAQAMSRCRSAFISVGVFSALINVLMLTGPLFMLQVYDRVLPSRSIPSLIGFVVLVTILYSFQALLEGLRSRLLIRIGASIDESISFRVCSLVARLPLVLRNQADGLQPVRDLDNIRSFFSGGGPSALFDLPWVPLYLGLCFLIHPLIGAAAVAGGILLFIVTLSTELLTREHTSEAAWLAARRNALLDANRRNAEVVHAMGMAERLTTRWIDINQDFMRRQRRVSDVAGGLGTLSRGIRLLLQSLILGLGAYLVILQHASPGIIIASSILVSRTLAPVDLAIANWKSFVAARQSYSRLAELLTFLPEAQAQLELPAPNKKFQVEGAATRPPQSTRVIVRDISFSLEAGTVLGVIGPSASGKSSLARLLVGVWPPASGRVCLDGASLEQWSPQMLGRHIGYLPQDVELFEGSIAENICRFDHEPDSSSIIEAAQNAGIHDVILALSEGYDTQIGEGGEALSAGQRQRVALARALYGDPFLVVLDEPNSNLDEAGDRALAHAIRTVRDRKGIAIVIAHRPSTMAVVDQVLVLMDGTQFKLGPKDEVLRGMIRPADLAAAE